MGGHKAGGVARVPEGFGVPSCVLFTPCLVPYPGGAAFPRHDVMIFGLGTTGDVPWLGALPVTAPVTPCPAEGDLSTLCPPGDSLGTVLRAPVSREVREEDGTGLRSGASGGSGAGLRLPCDKGDTQRVAPSPRWAP